MNTTRSNTADKSGSFLSLGEGIPQGRSSLQEASHTCSFIFLWQAGIEKPQREQSGMRLANFPSL
jgi:hypothetical protein